MKEWEDNMRKAMTPDGVITEGGVLNEDTLEWKDNFRSAWTPTGLKLANGILPSGVFVGYVTNGGSFPTKRLDNTPLQNEDYVYPLRSSTFPFQITYAGVPVTFTNFKDCAVWTGTYWQLKAGVIQDTQETPIRDATVESISGTALTQKDVNTEVKSHVSELYSKKVDKGTQSSGEYVYTRRFGSEGQYPMDYDWAANTIARRYTSGRLRVGDPVDDHDATDKIYVDTEIKKTLRFKGYVSETEPTGGKKDEVWYESDEMPTTVPISVKVHDGTAWSSGTQSYTPERFEILANDNDDNEYYWYNGAWNPIDAAGGNTFQVETLPTPDASQLGKIYEYIGVDTPTYKNGYIYQCVQNTPCWQVEIMPYPTVPEITYTTVDPVATPTPVQLYADILCTKPLSYWLKDQYLFPTSDCDESESLGRLSNITHVDPEYRWIQKDVQPDSLFHRGGYVDGDIVMRTDESIATIRTENNAKGIEINAGNGGYHQYSRFAAYGSRGEDEGTIVVEAVVYDNEESRTYSSELTGHGKRGWKIDNKQIITSDLLESKFQEEFNNTYPVGSYFFGNNHPTRGTWTEVTGDKAIWIKSGTADGTNITQALPKPSVTTSISSNGDHTHSRGNMNIKGYFETFWPNINTSGALIGERTSYDNPILKTEGTGTYRLGIDASANWTGNTSSNGNHSHTATSSVGTSGAYGTGTKVQPDAVVMKVWKRTA